MKKVFSIILILAICMSLNACFYDAYKLAETSDEKTDDYYESTTEETEDEVTASEETESEDPEVSPEPLPDPQVIYADFDVTTNPEGSFNISTNLPDETELMLTLKGRGYLAQGKAIVENGVAVSERFTDQGDQLVGDFTLEVMMPIPNVQTDYVKHFIGKNGEYLEGPYLEGALGSVVVRKEFKVSFPRAGETSSEASSTSSSAGNPTADGNYYRTPSGEKYHLDPNCGGKNSYQTTNISGLSPCSKCAE